VENALVLDAGNIEDGTGEYTQGQNENEWTYRAKPGKDGRLLPCTVMFGDSFADAFVRAGFTAYFSEFHKFYNWEFTKKYLEMPAGTRYVIFQHIEPFLNPFFNPAFWPEVAGAGPALTIPCCRVQESQTVFRRLRFDVAHFAFFVDTFPAVDGNESYCMIEIH
jgi:hypothetical protein